MQWTNVRHLQINVTGFPELTCGTLVYAGHPMSGIAENLILQVKLCPNEHFPSGKVVFLFASDEVMFGVCNSVGVSDALA